MPKAITNAFVYAGFQCVTMPTMVACATPLPNSKGCKKAMWISFAMNAVVLVLSVFMLLTWKDVYTGVDGGTVIPTLTSCNAMSINWLTTVYGYCGYLGIIVVVIPFLTVGYIKTENTSKSTAITMCSENKQQESIHLEYSVKQYSMK